MYKFREKHKIISEYNLIQGNKYAVQIQTTKGIRFQD